jgi:hypothetical protein
MTEKVLGKATRIWQYTRPGSESQLEVWEVLPEESSP